MSRITIGKKVIINYYEDDVSIVILEKKRKINYEEDLPKIKKEKK